MPLQPPPRDSKGNVTEHDHAGIHEKDGIIRRISEQQIVNDEKIGGRRLSTMAFRPSTDPTGGMSVDLQNLIEEAQLDPRMYVTDSHWSGSV